MTTSMPTMPTRRSLSRRTPLIALACLGALAIGLGGCNNNKMKEKDAQLASLSEENKSLRDDNDRLNNELKSTSERASAMESELATLKANPASASGGGGGGGGDRVLTVAGDVAFGPGQVTLTAAGKREVDNIISIIKSQYAGSRIEVAGFTDSDPLKKTKDKYTDNENLSVQRALAVERYMNDRGIPSDLTHSSGYGPSSPKGSKKESRRVEIRILAN